MRGNTTKIKTLPQILFRHFLDLQHETAISGNTFAANVREHYENSFPEHARTIEWSRVSDIALRMQRDYEKVKRWLDDTSSHFPLEVLESFIAAFPPDRRFKLQMEIARRQDMMIFHMPTGKYLDRRLNAGKVAKETGEALIALAALFPDGNDPHLQSLEQKAVSEIDEAISALLSARAAVLHKNQADICIFPIDLDEIAAANGAGC